MTDQYKVSTSRKSSSIFGAKRLSFFATTFSSLSLLCCLDLAKSGAFAQGTANKSSTSDSKEKKGSLSECFSGEDATLIEDVSNEDFPVSWKMLVDAGDTCTHLIFGGSYVTWADD